jgi:two-component system cell cycle sensor histidine kinase/response regulator CckA
LQYHNNMPLRHSLLKQQFKQHFGETFVIPGEWQGFVDAVDAAYSEFDGARVALERSLELNSQELKQANSELRALFQTIPDLLFRLDEEGTILDFKSSASDPLLHHHEFFGKRIQDISDRHIGDQFRNAIRQALETRSMVSLEYSFKLKTEEYFYEARLVPLLEKQVVAIIRNITEPHRAGQNLRRMLSLLQSTLESTWDGLLVVDLSGEIVTFNHRFGMLWRIPQNLLEARVDAAVLATGAEQLKDPEAFVRKVRELYNDTTAESFDVLEFKDGRVFERYSCPQRLDGVPVGRVWSFRDVTERKRSEESLLKLSRAVEQTADSVLISDASGIIEYVNPAFTAITGYTREDIVGKSPRVLKSGRHDQKFYAGLWNTVLGGKVYSGVIINRKKDGKLYFAEKTITPIKDGSGQITHFVSTEKDITERNELESQLRQSQKMEAFGQLAAGVAHDFNNILTVIQGNAGMLQTQNLKPVEQASALAEIVYAGERAANLTRQLLTFSRRQPMQPQNVDLNEVVVNVTKMLKRLIGEHISLEACYAPGDAPVHADPGMMAQVLMNLAVNSRDAMPKGGKLVLQTATIVVGETPAPANPNARPGQYVRLSVSDTGNGIAPENLPHIFEPFFTTKEVGRGTGLGLATVFGIVEQHRGWIDVESQVNQGTTFHVYLPCLAKGASPPATPRTPLIGLQGAETILLVEDETPVRNLMQSLLKRHGYRVHAAASGAQALEVWQNYRDTIEILVTDMVMPEGVSGRDLADRLRAEKPDLKILFCSGYSDEMLGNDSPLRHHENFLAKPFELATFLQRVRDCASVNK